MEGCIVSKISSLLPFRFATNHLKMKRDRILYYLDWLSLSFIIISVILFSIETLPNLNADEKSLLRSSETIIVFVFSIEYILRIYFAEKKLNYIFSFYKHMKAKCKYD